MDVNGATFLCDKATSMGPIVAPAASAPARPRSPPTAPSASPVAWWSGAPGRRPGKPARGNRRTPEFRAPQQNLWVDPDELLTMKCR